MAKISSKNIAKAIYLARQEMKDNNAEDFYKKTVHFLFKKKLLSKSAEILEKLEKVIDEEENIIRIKISSYKKLDEVYKKEIISKIKKRYQDKEIVLEEFIDEKLLGGINLEANNEIIDLSIKSKISRLQDYLKRKHD